MNRRIKSARTVSQLCSIVLDEVLTFDSVNTPHALARLARLRKGSRRPADPPELPLAIEALTRRMHQLIGTYDAWGTTQSLWAYSQLGYVDEPSLQTLCQAVLDVAPILKPVDCANALVALAHLDYVQPELLRQIVTTVLDTIDEFQPAELSQALWAFARLGCHPGAALVNEVVGAVQWRVQQFGTQELVMLLWALVRLRHRPGPRFLHDVESVLLQRLPHLAPVDVTVSVWSFAHLHYKAVRLLDEVPQLLVPQLASVKNSELCSLISGFATAYHYHRVLLDAAAEVVLSRLDSLSHREVCVVLWTYGTFRHRPAHADFGRQLAAALYARMESFAPQGLAMVAKALAQLQWRSEPLMAELVAAAEARLPDFKPLELSQLLWGLSALQCREMGIYYAVVRRCIAILKDPGHPHHRTMTHYRVVNSVILSCQSMGYVPWTLIDFAESRGIRVKQPEVLSSRDEDDEALAAPLGPPACASSGEVQDDEDGGGGEDLVEAAVGAGGGAGGLNGAAAAERQQLHVRRAQGLAEAAAAWGAAGGGGALAAAAAVGAFGVGIGGDGSNSSSSSTGNGVHALPAPGVRAGPASQHQQQHYGDCGAALNGAAAAAAVAPLPQAAFDAGRADVDVEALHVLARARYVDDGAHFHHHQPRGRPDHDSCDGEDDDVVAGFEHAVAAEHATGLNGASTVSKPAWAANGASPAPASGSSTSSARVLRPRALGRPAAAEPRSAAAGAARGGAAASSFGVGPRRLSRSAQQQQQHGLRADGAPSAVASTNGKAPAAAAAGAVEDAEEDEAAAGMQGVPLGPYSPLNGHAPPRLTLEHRPAMRGTPPMPASAAAQHGR